MRILRNFFLLMVCFSILSFSYSLIISNGEDIKIMELVHAITFGYVAYVLNQKISTRLTDS